MPLPVHPDLFLFPFEDLDGEEDDLETLAPSDPADLFHGVGVDDLSVDRRSFPSESNQFSPSPSIGQDGLRIVDSDSETDTDERMIAIGDTSLGNEIDPSFRWECLPIEEIRMASIDDFEWEDLADRVDEGEILSLEAFPGEDVENPNPNPTEIEEELDFERRDFEWEVLLAVNVMGTINGADSVHGEDEEGFDFASDYDASFDQFVDHVGAEWMKCGRPAAKSVVESLPSVLLTAEDVAQNNTHCAICSDEVSLAEKVKRLPCLHHYHEYCILPWLVMRNTCPLCRYELPSNDAGEEVQSRYDFVILQDS